MFQATRMFASNMSEGLVQRFYNVYLLPRIRDDIEFYKKLNFHLMSALKKAIYKPAAFFKGILLPLVSFHKIRFVPYSSLFRLWQQTHARSERQQSSAVACESILFLSCLQLLRCSRLLKWNTTESIRYFCGRSSKRNMLW